jgi:pimeloyl-ACP methyl ester carboxylesterase
MTSRAMTIREAFFDSAGVPIRYVERGAGAPLVLVHSYTGTFESQFVRKGFADALAQRYRVIGFDLRGHGRSGKPHDPACYGREMGLDVVRLLDHLRIDKAHILGYSLGAHIVAQLLTLREERFLTAILGGSAGRRHWSEEDEARVETEAAEIEGGTMRDQVLRLWPAGMPPPTEAPLRDLSARYLAGNDAHALAAIRRSNRDQVVDAAALTAVKVPMLGIVGTLDRYMASFRELAAVVPTLRLALIEGATHSTAPARPEFRQLVLEFLGAHPGAT